MGVLLTVSLGAEAADVSLFSRPIDDTLAKDSAQQLDVIVSDMRKVADGDRLRVQIGQDPLAFSVTELSSGSADAVIVRARSKDIQGLPALVLVQSAYGTYGVFPDASGILHEVRTQDGKTFVRRLPDWRETVGPSTEPDYVVIPPPAEGSPHALAMHVGDADAAKAGEAQVDVLALYSNDVVAMLGSEGAAVTYFESLFALANTAYSDSGAGVVLRPTRFVRTAHSGTMTNSMTLQALQNNTLSDGLDVNALREADRADLVTLLKDGAPVRESGGIANALGFNLRPDNLDTRFGFSVVAFGGYVLAHEIAHNFGANHDIETETRADGTIKRGAHLYSHGKRQGSGPSFYSIMAYYLPGQTQSNQAPYFSHPGTTLCFGVSCGEHEVMDNARTIRKMAPRIAAFRLPHGVLAAVPTETTEQEYGRFVRVTARLGRAQAVPVSVRVSTQDDTAIAGQDYVALNRALLTIPAGATSASINVSLLADDLEEPDERFIVTLSEPSDPALELQAGEVIIQDDDPRVVISGRIDWQRGPAPPTSVRISLYGVESTGAVHSFFVSAPDYAFSLKLRPGAVVEAIVGAPPESGYMERSFVVGPYSSDDSGLVLPMLPPATLSGRVVFPADVTPPSSAVTVILYGYAGISNVGRQLTLQPPDFTFSQSVMQDAEIRVLALSPGAPLVDTEAVVGPLQANAYVEVVMSRFPSIRPTASNAREGTQRVWVRAFFSGAPRENLSFRARTIAGGTATASVDFVPLDTVVSVAGGSGFVYIDVPITVIDDGHAEDDETVFVELSDPVNGTISTYTVAVTILDDDDGMTPLLADGFESSSLRRNGPATASAVGH